VIPKWICLLEAGKKIPVHGSGTQVRAFLYVSDVVRAYSLILHQGQLGQVYNISSNIEMRNVDLAHHMAKLWNRTPEEAIEFVRDRHINDERYHINDDKMRNLGWAPEVGFDEGLSKTVAWYRGRNLEEVWENYTPHFLAAHPSLPKEGY